MNGPGEE